MDKTNIKIISFFRKLSFKEKLILTAALVVGGLLLVNIGTQLLGGGTDTGGGTETSVERYRAETEARLKETLEQVAGVGKVDVMITFSSDMNKSLVYNETTGSSGATTKEVVMEKSTSGSTPYSASDVYPEVTGVIIVADGADDIKVKTGIIEAVKVALGIASHKIVVLTRTK